MVKWLWTLTSLCFLVFRGVSGDQELLEQTFGVLEGLLKFFSEDYSSINVDGLFGLRLGEGQLKLALNQCQLNPNCGKEIISRISKLAENVGEACDKALPYVESEDPEYFRRFKQTIDAPYILSFDSKSIPQEVIKKAEIGKSTRYNEDKGDDCYARLLGTYMENDRLVPKCNVTNACWDMMNQDDTSDYIITHQLLYFIIAEKVGCLDALEKFSSALKISDIQKTFCSKIYKESLRLAENGNCNENRRDLFLEQSVLCGPLGFENFLRNDWIEMSLKWPNKQDGCFKHSFFVKKRSSPTMRRLLREKYMKGNCLSHTSGLGFGTYSLYVHHLVRQM